jgi:hypothetical protein
VVLFDAQHELKYGTIGRIIRPDKNYTFIHPGTFNIYNTSELAHCESPDYTIP